tara:strand:- start:36 stop:209 length:174 start_codon:yes stop_codon:yes gene_type:complete
MRKILILFFIFLTACSYKNIKDEGKYDFDYSDNMSFKEFKIKLEQYTKSSSYPDIDN